jgi:TPR repeat protein
MVFARPKSADFADLRAVSTDELQALVDKSPQIGARLVESAAHYGLLTAQMAWARMLLHGQGAPMDQEAACHWFSVAAESGDAEAINMVGRCYELGWGVPANPRYAESHYRQAARKNYAWAQYNLGQLLLSGEPTPAKRREGLGWHLLAAKAGHAKSMNVVGRFCEEGWDMPKSVDNALGWFRKSAEAGDSWGQFNLGRVLAGDGDIEQALLWLRRAIEGGGEAFVAGIMPSLTQHPDPAIRALGPETAARRERARRQAAAAALPSPHAPSAPRAQSRFRFGRIFSSPARAVVR